MAKKSIERLHATVFGRVQGVSFRFYTRDTADELGLTGWVANRYDGSVEVVAEGPRAALDQLLSTCTMDRPWRGSIKSSTIFGLLPANSSASPSNWDEASG